MKWYIGQDIVCIKTHSQGFVKKGEVYTIKSLRQACCHIGIDVGLIDSRKGLNYTSSCIKCNSQINNGKSPVLWFGDSLFVPLESLVNLDEIEEILQIPIEELFQV